MKTSNSQPGDKNPKAASLLKKEDRPATTGPAAKQEEENKKDKKNKKKHSSALEAAAVARNAVEQVKPGAYRDVDYRHTGTNLSYREEEEGE